MSDDITIPPEALDAGADEFADAMQCPKRCERTFHSLKGVPCECSNRARAACLAMLKAWPGMGIEVARDESEAIILPLTQEKTNENGH